MRIAAAFILAVPLVWAADTPETLVSADEAEPIHSAIIRKEAWTLEPVRRLRAEAENCMKEGPWTVTADRPKGIELDPHEYYSESPYWWPNPANPAGPFVRRDGQPNPARFAANHAALNAMSGAIFTLGAAAFFLDDPRYAQRAARDIQAWFIAPRTRMNPTMQHAQTIPGSGTAGGGAAEGRALVRAIQGMEFLAQSANWDSRDHAAVRKWFEEYLRWLAPSGQDAGIRRNPADRNAWWAAQLAAGATFAEDSAGSGAAFDYFRNRILPRQARFNPARDRAARPLPPPLANLEGVATLCRIAQVRGVELWNARARNGVTVAGLIDSSAPNLSDPKKWNRDQFADFQGDGVYFLAFAGMGLSRPDYIALFRKLERPDSGWLAVVDLLVSRWEAAGHQTRH